MAKRIYHVKSKHGDQLVRAHTPSAAVRKASEGHFSAEVASQDTLVELLSKGHKVLDAGVEQGELPMEDNEAT